MNFIKKTLTLGAVLVSFLAVGSQAMAKEYTVKMVTNLDADQVYYFEPAEITIQPGDTIKWVNVQEDMHNAVADAVPEGAEFFESPMLEEEGASWSYTFNTAGTYSYHCHPHAAAGMKGMITVGAPSAPEDMQGGAHAKGQQCKPGMDCPMHEDMKMKGDMMMDHGNMQKKTSDDGHGGHDH